MQLLLKPTGELLALFQLLHKEAVEDVQDVYRTFYTEYYEKNKRKRFFKKLLPCPDWVNSDSDFVKEVSVNELVDNFFNWLTTIWRNRFYRLKYDDAVRLRDYAKDAQEMIKTALELDAAINLTKEDSEIFAALLRRKVSDDGQSLIRIKR